MCKPRTTTVRTRKPRVAPISRLPNELLEKIFLFARGTQDALCTSDTIYSIGSPWVFLNVCPRWNAIALDIRQLWDSILIKLDGKDKALLPSYFTLLCFYLARGGARPFDFSLLVRNDYVWDQDSRRIVDALVLHSGRWRNVTIQAHYPVLAFLGHMQPRSNPQGPNASVFNSLECITLDALLQTHECWPRRQERKTINTLFSAPRLRSVDLRYTALAYIVTLPMDRLTQCTMFSDSRSEIDRLLTRGRNLVTADIWLNPSIVQHLAEMRVALPNLQNLQITASRLQNFTPLISVLSAPRLRSLRLRSLIDGTYPVPEAIDIHHRKSLFDALAQLLERCNCNLTKFAFIGGMTIGDEVLRLLRRTPNLSSLTLKGICEDSVISRLHLLRTSGRGPNASSSMLVPNVETLELGETSSLDTVLLMLSSRVPGPGFSGNIHNGRGFLRGLRITVPSQLRAATWTSAGAVSNWTSRFNILIDRGLSVQFDAGDNEVRAMFNMMGRVLG